MDSRITNLIVAAVFTERSFFIEFSVLLGDVTRPYVPFAHVFYSFARTCSSCRSTRSNSSCPRAPSGDPCTVRWLWNLSCTANTSTSTDLSHKKTVNNITSCVKLANADSSKGRKIFQTSRTSQPIFYHGTCKFSTYYLEDCRRFMDYKRHVTLPFRVLANFR